MGDGEGEEDQREDHDRRRDPVGVGEHATRTQRDS